METRKGKRLVFSVGLQDCSVEEIASRGGNGGQNKNRRHTAIRIRHAPSGAEGYSADERNQHRNKVEAFRKLSQSKEFQLWARVEASRLQGLPSLDSIVDDSMSDKNLRIDRKSTAGLWEPWPDWKSDTTSGGSEK
ncbi:hypothetical protein KW807_02830 [Candidatus Parcubacteria bacterium]|nr:hypothetical protein [Candidatus Parcubacteria bacterium]